MVILSPGPEEREAREVQQIRRKTNGETAPSSF